MVYATFVGPSQLNRAVTSIYRVYDVLNSCDRPNSSSHTPGATTGIDCIGLDELWEGMEQWYETTRGT